MGTIAEEPPHAALDAESEQSRARLLATRELAAAQAALASARDEIGILGAVAGHIAGYKPKDMQLFYFDDEQLMEYQLVAAWDFADGPAAPPLPQRSLRVADWELAPLFREHPESICIVSDVPSDPRLSHSYRQRTAQAGCAAILLLPLYCRSQQGWQGVLQLNWAHPHPPQEAERLTYELLVHTLSALVTIRRQSLARQEVMDALNALSLVSSSLGAMGSLSEALRSITSWAIERGAIATTLSQILLDSQGHPDEVEVLSEWRSRTPKTSAVGMKIKLRDTLMSRVWVENPDAPLLIGNCATDPQVDGFARELFLQRGIAAVALLPLRINGRWIGLLSTSWSTPTSFDERDERVYKAIAGYAAIVLDNRLLVDRMQAALRENQHQRSSLQAIVDYIPVGVFVAEVPSGKPILINRKGIEILGQGAETAVNRDNYDQIYKTYVPGTDQVLPSSDLALVRTMDTGLPHQGEVDLKKSDGTRTSLVVSSGPILDEAGVMKSAAVTFVDVTESKRAEAERNRIQQEMITVQAAALAERGTPLIPISDEILVLPLIGALDTERGQQLMDVLLHGVSHSGARVAIIDITGVRIMDTQAASTLTSAAQALRLLGVEPVLTGIRAEVAQTLVSLGVSLTGIVTRSTLQSGIAYANRKKGTS